MNAIVKDGVWPTMVTPFTAANSIDYAGLEEMIEWYIAHHVDGLFAVCQSSEMFYLSLEERVSLARFVKKQCGDRIPVIASGHISASLDDQIYELRRMAETGVDALVLVSNRLAGMDEPEDIWKQNAERILQSIPDIPLGLYECPHPYKRLMSPELLQWCALTGRFSFLKDTCCDVREMASKIEAVKNTALQIFNANSATLWESMKIGIAGYCGVMGNFHPDLYSWMVRNGLHEPERAQRLQNFLGLSSVVEAQCYPVNAKYYLQREGVNISLYTRSREYTALTASHRLELQQLHALTQEYWAAYRV